MTPTQIVDTRAFLAWWLSTEAKAKIPEIRAILRCRRPDDVRTLVARGRRLRKITNDQNPITQIL